MPAHTEPPANATLQPWGGGVFCREGGGLPGVWGFGGGRKTTIIMPARTVDGSRSEREKKEEEEGRDCFWNCPSVAVVCPSHFISATAECFHPSISPHTPPLLSLGRGHTLLLWEARGNHRTLPLFRLPYPVSILQHSIPFMFRFIQEMSGS